VNPCQIKLSSTIHLGKNPKNGGRPPKDNKFKKIKFRLEASIFTKESWEIKNTLN